MLNNLESACLKLFNKIFDSFYWYYWKMYGKTDIEIINFRYAFWWKNIWHSFTFQVEKSLHYII